MAAAVYLLSALTIILYFIYSVSKRKFKYWKDQNIPYLQPEPIFGNYRDYIFLKRYLGDVTGDICRRFPGQPYIGTYYGTEPALIVQDPEVLKLVTTKDYYYFSSREVSNYTHKEVFTQSMFFTYGDRWKVLRQNFSPLFSSAKMRNMFHLIEKCSHVFEDLLQREAKAPYIEVRSLMSRFTMDCIGSCVFGMETNVMGEDTETNAFRRIGELLFEVSNARALSLIARSIWPAIYYGIGLKAFPKALNNFFSDLITGVFRSRNFEASSRNDFVDLILTMKKQEYITGDSLSNMKSYEAKKVNIKVDDELLVGQCLGFFAGGFETSSTTLSFTLFELAKNVEAQNKAAKEVDEYLEKHNNKLEYNCTKELPYLSACVDETLRLYPILAVMTREVVEEYTLPCGARLEPGIRIHIPVYNIQRNPDFFPDPEKYKPERFLPENKNDIKPYTYMPFGEGPRLCIGYRFARMQMMPGLITVLKNYRVELAPGMDPDIVLEPKSFTTQPRGGIHLKLSPRDSKKAFVR